MIAVDILEVLLYTNSNHYLPVLPDYFTKWCDAIPLPDQMAALITRELVKILSIYGHPEILHSDQGPNFESSILAQHCRPLVCIHPEQQLTTLKEMVW